MNKLIYTLFVVATMAITTGCNSNKQKSETNTECCSNETKSCCSSKSEIPAIDASKVSVVYFHATRRCATCEAVEKVTKETLAKHFDGSVPFHSINREEEKELAKKYKIEWQTLMIMKGDNVKNITNEAFLNARTKPEKLEALIKSTIESML
ncbi:nitrophenyl compound nitroreductase subunit ArsF family protein [Carboxylicivirga marina]|uniref:Thioredoxin family protein n=1 Tax=Carboxylicivirga marina TaxID=2800988 RepID=A0ABS1HMI6_9BACT|nr:nitrophenyl compound nitroreductase subunit ArsF family protein [Carboxylicivirga marina]MBK3518473.1 thioredoxin family protein [Carboxylicivirga marina]